LSPKSKTFKATLEVPGEGEMGDGFFSP